MKLRRPTPNTKINKKATSQRCQSRRSIDDQEASRDESFDCGCWFVGKVSTDFRPPCTPSGLIDERPPKFPIWSSRPARKCSRCRIARHLSQPAADLNLVLASHWGAKLSTV